MEISITLLCFPLLNVKQAESWVLVYNGSIFLRNLRYMAAWRIKISLFVFIVTLLCIYIFCSLIKDVDVELRVVCEQFIQNVSESLIVPLSAFLTKVNKCWFHTTS